MLKTLFIYLARLNVRTGSPEKKRLACVLGAIVDSAGGVNLPRETIAEITDFRH